MALVVSRSAEVGPQLALTRTRLNLESSHPTGREMEKRVDRAVDGARLLLRTSWCKWKCENDNAFE
jgi:hypothetical protein